MKLPHLDEGPLELVGDLYLLGMALVAFAGIAYAIYAAFA